MFIEARVLDRQHGLLHQVGHLRDRDEVAPLDAELADQHLVGGVNTKRDLRFVIGDGIDLRHVLGDRPKEIPDKPGAGQQQ